MSSWWRITPSIHLGMDPEEHKKFDLATRASKPDQAAVLLAVYTERRLKKAQEEAERRSQKAAQQPIQESMQAARQTLEAVGNVQQDTPPTVSERVDVRKFWSAAQSTGMSKGVAENRGRQSEASPKGFDSLGNTDVIERRALEKSIKDKIRTQLFTEIGYLEQVMKEQAQAEMDKVEQSIIEEYRAGTLNTLFYPGYRFVGEQYALNNVLWARDDNERKKKILELAQERQRLSKNAAATEGMRIHPWSGKYVTAEGKDPDLDQRVMMVNGQPRHRLTITGYEQYQRREAKQQAKVRYVSQFEERNGERVLKPIKINESLTLIQQRVELRSSKPGDVARYILSGESGGKVYEVVLSANFSVEKITIS